MDIEFAVTDWAAWAPGLYRKEDWMAWAQAPFAPRGEDSPALSEVPAMQRRRIDRLGRMAIQTAYWCQGAEAGVCPFVFASRHGDVAGSVELLETLVRDEPLSPTSFGLSVHNAIAALYSIVRGDRGNYLALAAGQATVETAVVEAAGLLADGAHEVLVVAYDAALPAVYADFADEPDPFHAWCWRIGPADAGGIRLGLQCGGNADPASTPGAGLPHGLEVLRFLLSGQREWVPRIGHAGWTWRRHD